MSSNAPAKNLAELIRYARDNPGKLVGMISLTDLLRARTRNLEEERHRERVLRLRLFPLQLKVAARR